MDTRMITDGSEMGNTAQCISELMEQRLMKENVLVMLYQRK